MVVTVANLSSEVVRVPNLALFWVAFVLSLDVAWLAVLSASCNMQLYLVISACWLNSIHKHTQIHTPTAIFRSTCLSGETRKPRTHGRLVVVNPCLRYSHLISIRVNKISYTLWFLRFITNYHISYHFVRVHGPVFVLAAYCVFFYYITCSLGSVPVWLLHPKVVVCHDDDDDDDDYYYYYYYYYCHCHCHYHYHYHYHYYYNALISLASFNVAGSQEICSWPDNLQ